MDRAHILQIGLRQYFGSILGLGLSYMQPSMNPCGYLVVKQAKKIEIVSLHGERGGVLVGKLIPRVIGLFPELEGEKNEEALMARGLEL